MNKIYMILIFGAGWFYYLYPDKFDELRGKSEAKVEQAVQSVQNQATESLIEVVHR